MKRKPLSNEHAAHRHPVQDGAHAASGECAAEQLVDRAQCYARKLMASAPYEKDGKTVPAGDALAALMSRRFGKMAPTVTAWCAMLAWSEGTDAGYRMWAEAFKSMSAAR